MAIMLLPKLYLEIRTRKITERFAIEGSNARTYRFIHTFTPVGKHFGEEDEGEAEEPVIQYE